jgi:hypothetical protein
MDKKNALQFRKLVYALQEDDGLTEAQEDFYEDYFLVCVDDALRQYCYNNERYNIIKGNAFIEVINDDNQKVCSYSHDKETEALQEIISRIDLAKLKNTDDVEAVFNDAVREAVDWVVGHIYDLTHIEGI